LASGAIASLVVVTVAQDHSDCSRYAGRQDGLFVLTLVSVCAFALCCEELVRTIWRRGSGTGALMFVRVAILVAIALAGFLFAFVWAIAESLDGCSF
jgi:hypothetical protein